MRPRPGVIASVVAHAAVILIAIVGFNNAEALQPDPVESIAVDLVPVTDASSVRQGSELSKVIDTTAPAVVKSDKPADLAKPTGNTAQDQPKPSTANTPSVTPTKNTAPAPTPKPQPEPQPVVPAAPAPQPQPQPKPEPEPQPEPEPAPAPQPKSQPKPEPQPATDTSAQQLAADNSTSADSAPAVPTPAAQSQNIEQQRAALKKQQEAAAKAAADAAKAASDAAAKAKADAAGKAAAQAKADAAAKAAEAAVQKAIADADAEQARKDAQARKQALAAQAAAAAKAADEISSIIDNEKATGAKTGQGGTPTAGKVTGTAAKLSQGEMDAFAAQVKKCWSLLPSEIEAGLVVDLLVNLNPDGSVNGTPKILQTDPSPMVASVARAGQRAVLECGPYTVLPRAKYAEWKQIDLELNAQD